MSCPAPVFPPARSRLECAFLSLTLALAIVGLILFSWIPAVRCRLQQLLFRVRHCATGNTDATLDLFADPNDWLGRNPAVAAAVIWERPGGALHPWRDWSRAERSALYDAFWRARMDQEAGIPEAPPEAAPEAADRPAGTWFPAGLAWRVFVAHVGQTLAAEEARWVPWRVTGHAPEQLAVLVDSRAFFRWDAQASRYAVNTWTSGSVTPGDPVLAFRFLRQNGMLGATPRQSVERLLEWCRANLIHFLGHLEAANSVSHWGYSGLPPVQRMIRGTTRASDGQFAHYTAGCHGTSGFLRAVLRTANLGVEVMIRCGHSLPRFLHDDLYLSHGDDPYSRVAHTRPPRPAGELLIGRPTFDRWFGPGVPDDQVCANVGRQPVEIALLYPTAGYLLWERCRDRAAGTAHADSRVYEVFGRYYTVAELEARDLWTRLDAEIAARGGCGAIPPG
jgi:hypothetical protein